MNDARDVALETLEALDEREAFLQPALQAAADRLAIDGRDRGLALELVQGVTRWRNRLDYSLDRTLQRGVQGSDPQLVRILRIGAYQLFFLDRIPERAAVHCAVEQVKWAVGEGPAKAANGVLRRLIREGEKLPEGDEPAALAVRWGHPEWLVRRWLAEDPTTAEARAAAHNDRAPLTIRPDHPEVDREALAERLRSEGATVEPGRHAPEALYISNLPAPFDTESFRQGWWQAQDEASQLIVSTLLDPQPGDRIWDACAAPGGKTRYIARAMQGQGRLLATDVHRKKAKRLERALRDHAFAAVHARDATDPPDETFDKVLLDAPCSGLGVIRRHPESKWRRTEQDIVNAADTQRLLLTSVAPTVKPGGTLVYSVCSEAPEEGDERVEAFLAAHPEFTLDDTLTVGPAEHGTDGFYGARLVRGETS